MRHAKQKAILLFLAVPIGLAIAVAVIAGPLESARRTGVQADTIYPALVIAGALGAGVAFFFAIVATLRARTEARLIRGEGVVGRWHVGTADWLRFLDADEARAGRLPTLRNRLKPQSRILGTEIDVVFGLSALLIDGMVVPLRRWSRQFRSTFGLVQVGWLEGEPEMLEFHGVTTRTPYEQGTTRVHKIAALRVPVPGAAREAARAVLAHYAASLPADIAARMQRNFPAHFAAAEPSTAARSGG